MTPILVVWLPALILLAPLLDLAVLSALLHRYARLHPNLKARLAPPRGPSEE